MRKTWFVHARGPTRFVWPGMILAGLALGAFVFAAWPEPTFRVIRLPYGEAMPKTPLAGAAPAAAKEIAAPSAAQIAPLAVPESAPDPIALVETEPAAEQEREQAPFAGPAPVRSELEDAGYAESAEDLGAEPLPGGPAGGADEPEPVADDPPAESDPPVLGVVIELP